MAGNPPQPPPLGRPGDARDGALLQELLARLADHPEAQREVAAAYEAMVSDGMLDTEAASDDPSSIGPYRTLSELGRGGQGVVYLAEDTRLHRKVALKVLTGLGPGSEKLVQRFRREAEVASRLDHPGICGIHDAGVSHGIPYIAMQVVEGQSLAQRITATKEVSTLKDTATMVLLSDVDGAGQADPDDEADKPPSSTSSSTSREQIHELLTVFEKAAQALHAAHEAGVVHRDIKPGNVMVTKSGDPVILDFGLAHAEDEDFESLTRTGDLFGTPAYMSPEQLTRGTLRLDRRTDVYSLGATLYECLTLRRPFEAPTREGLYQAIMSVEPPDPRRLNRSVSADLRVVIETALAKDRDRRYQTAEALADDLAAVRELHPIAARPVGPLGRLLRWSKRRPAVASLLLVLTIGIPSLAGLSGYIIANLPQIEAQEQQQLYEETERLLEQGFFELDHGDPGEAQTTFEQALAKRPHLAEAIVGLALTFLEGKQPQAALDLLDREGGQSAEPAALSLIRADVLDVLGRTGEAADARAAAPAPESAVALFLAASREIAKGDALMSGAAEQAACEAAREMLQRAIVAAPIARRVYHYGLAYTLGRLKLKAASRDVATGIRLLWPGSALGQARCGFALHRTDPPAAIAAYRTAIRLDPGNAYYHNALGGVLQSEGLLDEAIAAYREAIRLDPGHSGAESNLLSLLWNRGTLGDAAKAFFTEYEGTADCRSTLRRILPTLPRDAVILAVLELERFALPDERDFWASLTDHEDQIVADCARRVVDRLSN